MKNEINYKEAYENMNKINKDLNKELKELKELLDKETNENLDLKMFKENLKDELKYKHNTINETKCNHLILADTSEYHHNRYIIEKEKLDLLEEIIYLLYN